MISEIISFFRNASLRQHYVAFLKIRATLMERLITDRKAGLIDDEQYERIFDAVIISRIFIDKMNAAVKKGEKRGDLKFYNALMQELLVEVKKLQTDGTKTGPSGKKPRDEMRTVKEIAQLTKKTTGRISQLCNEGKIYSEGQGRSRRVNTLSAYEYFAELNMKKMEQKIKRIGMDQLKDDREIKRDAMKMRKKQ